LSNADKIGEKNERFWETKYYFLGANSKQKDRVVMKIDIIPPAFVNKPKTELVIKLENAAITAQRNCGRKKRNDSALVLYTYEIL